MAKKNESLPIDKKAVELSAYETIVQPQGFAVTPPNQEIAESDKTPEWFIQNVRYICSFYNVSFRNVLAPLTGLENTEDVVEYNRPVYQMIKYMEYYLGKQPNLDYSHLTQNVKENNLQASWIKGSDISELVKFMKGNILDKINNVHISAQPMSEEAQSEREDMLHKLTMKVQLKPQFDRLKEAGMQYNPANGQEFDSEDEIKNWMEQGGFKDAGAEYATAIANNFWFTNFCASKFIQSFNYIAICGVTAMEHCVDNGKSYMRPVLPYQLILDTRIDDDYNREAQFIGSIDCMTPTQLFAKFPNSFSAQQKDDIYESCKSQELGNKYNNIANFSWWNYNSRRQNNTISVVTCYWYGRHDLGLKKGKNKYGVNNIGRVPKGESGEYILTDIHKATFVGNRYLLDYGYIDNVVEEFTNKAKPIFPIIRFMPDMVGGEFISIVSRLHKLQDELDALNFIIRERIGRAIGKVHAIRGAKLGNGTNAETITKDLKSMGFTIITESGERPEGSDRYPLIETIDWSLDPAVLQYINLVQAKEAKMKEIVSTSNVALGQQSTYIGLGTQQSTIGQSTYGLKGLYDGFFDFVQQNLQYAINVEGRLMAMNDDLETAMVVGDSGKRYLDVMKIKDISWEDILIYLKLNDQIDEADKKSLQQAIFALFQNDKMSLSEFAEVMGAKTYTDLKNRAEKFEKIRDKKQQELAAQQHAQAQELQAKQIQGANQAEAMRQAGQTIRGHQSNDAEMQQAMLAQQQAQPSQ